MRIFQKVKDGGPDSPVTAYVLFEFKNLFSIMLLHFPGDRSRDTFHSHAFNAVTLWVKGAVREDEYEGGWRYFSAGRWKYTPRDMIHRIVAERTGAWALTFRGPWVDQWMEVDEQDRKVVLTHGRIKV